MGALLQAHQLHIKYEGCVGRNDARVPLAPISKVRSASQLGTLPDTHLGYSLIPTTNHFLFANFEFERLSSVPGGVKLASICQRA